MFNAEDLPLWAYIVTVAVGSAAFFHQQRQAAEKHGRQLAQLEERLMNRIDSLEKTLAGEQQELRPRFRLLRRIT